MKKDWFYLKNTKTGKYLIKWIDTETVEEGYSFGEKATMFTDDNIGKLPVFIQMDIEDGYIVKEAI